MRVKWEAGGEQSRPGATPALRQRHRHRSGARCSTICLPGPARSPTAPQRPAGWPGGPAPPDPQSSSSLGSSVRAPPFSGQCAAQPHCCCGAQPRTAASCPNLPCGHRLCCTRPTATWCSRRTRSGACATCRTASRPVGPAPPGRPPPRHAAAAACTEATPGSLRASTTVGHAMARQPAHAPPCRHHRPRRSSTCSTPASCRQTAAPPVCSPTSASWGSQAHTCR